MARKKVDEPKIKVGKITDVHGEVNIATGDIYKGFTAEQVSVLVTQITTTFQPQKFAGQCPYKGLDVFEEEDAELFFGREKLVNELVSRVKDSRTVFVTGPSGSGKSSLVRAGLIHALKQGVIKNSRRWLYATMKPGRDPLGELARVAAGLAGSTNAEDEVRAKALTDATIFTRWCEIALKEGQDKRAVLFIDQFEEVFTQISKDTERVAFLNLLTHAATVESGRVIILFSMRSDFVSYCATYPQLNALLNRQFVQIGAMQPEELVSAIAQPALRVGLSIDPELIAQMINDMKGEPGSLPLMQFALKDLFEAEQAKGGLIALTLNDYLQHGGIQKSLERHADVAFAKLGSNEQELARAIFSGLIEIGRGTQDTRRTALFNELVPANTKAEDVETIVRKLADARLITTDETAGKDTVTISHEKLIDAWPWLKKLVNENRDVIALQNEIAEDAEEWEEHKREASYLYTGARLINAHEKLEAKKLVLSGSAFEFVKAGQAQQRRGRVTLISVVVTTIGVLIIAVIVFSIQSNFASQKAIEADQQRSVAEKSVAIALENEREARKAQKEAEYEKDQAELAREEAKVSKNIAAAQRSAARAQIYQFRPGELYTSTLLAIDSWQSIPSDEAEEILRKNISLFPIPVKQMTHAGRINAVEFNPEGDVFVTASADGSACAWQVSDGKNLFCADSPGAVNDAGFSPTENIVITGDSEGNVQIINADSGVVETQIAIGFPIRDVDILNSGKFAAVTSDDDRITLIDLKARKKGFFLEGTKIKFAAFSPNGLQVATGSGNGLVSIWTLNSASPPIESRKHIGEVLTLEFSPNGFYVVTGGVDGAVVVTETKTGDEKFRGYHDDQVKDIAFNPAGNWFVTVSNDRRIRVWDINNGRQILSMSQSNFVQAVTVSANGQWIATTGDDKTIRVWNASTGTELFQTPTNGTVLGFSKDGKYLVSGNESGVVNIWDITAMPSPTNYLQFNGVTTSALYSPTGGLIAASDDKRIWLLNPATLSKLTTRPSVNPLAELKSNITQLVFSPKEKWIGAITTGNDVVIYNTQNRNGKTLQPKNLVQAIVFSPDEKQLFIGDGAGNLQVWDTATGTFRDTPLALSSRITAMTASADLLAIGTDHTVIIFDVNTLAELARLDASGAPELLVFSPDGSWLASSNSESQIHIWEQINGKFSEPKVINKEDVVSMAFNSSKSLLAIGATDKVYLFNPATLEEFARIPQTGTVSSVWFSLDGATLMTSSLKVLQFWDLTKITEIKKENMIEIACQHLIENFTKTQWSALFENEPYKVLCPNLPVP